MVIFGSRLQLASPRSCTDAEYVISGNNVRILIINYLKIPNIECILTNQERECVSASSNTRSNSIKQPEMCSG
jgi:hypothetical protein